MDVYTGVIRLFALPASKLVPLPCSQLYRGEPPDSQPFPWAVLTPTSDDNNLAWRTRQHEWHKATFDIEIVDRTEEEVSSLGWQIRKAFIDGDLIINTWNGVVPLRALTYKGTKGPDQMAPDLWIAALTFDMVYPVLRPGFSPSQ